MPDRYESVVGELREWMAEADQAVWPSAGQTGGGKPALRHRQRLPARRGPGDPHPAGDDSFSPMRAELAAQGFTRTDRKYLVWVAAAVGICGLGKVHGDARPGPTTATTAAPRTPGWTPRAGSMPSCTRSSPTSAPSSPTPHTAAPPGTAPTTVCTPEHEALVDCGDDYVNTDPPSGNYLATHWNTANSSFLQNDTASRSGPLVLDRRRHDHLRRPGPVGRPPDRRADHRRHPECAGEPVRRRAGTGGEQGAGTATTGADGTAAFTPTPGDHHHLPDQLPRLGHHGIADSPQVTITVRPELTARLKASTVTMSSTITVTGAVAPTTTASASPCTASPVAPGRAWPP